MQKITPFLWYNGNLEEAINFYTSIFPNSKVRSVHRVGGEKGKMFTATFELEGQEFMALDGGPMYSFTPAVSFFVKCKTQEEVDNYWTKLLEGGGKEDRCGWLRDRFGLSWQIIPDALGELMGGPDANASKRVMEAMMGMVKLDIKGLQAAYDNK